MLSGNRNFEGRVHPATRANYLASPPLVVAYALAGRVDIDFEKEPIGKGKDGKDVYLLDIWPNRDEVNKVVGDNVTAEMFITNYKDILKGSKMWQKLEAGSGKLYNWDDKSTYIRDPPFFKSMKKDPTPTKSL